MRPGTLNCSQSQTYSGWNCFTLSFLRWIFSAHLHTWIIAGCQRCGLSWRSSVFVGLARAHSSCPLSNLQTRQPPSTRWLMFWLLRSRDGDHGGYLVEQSRSSQSVLGPANSGSAHSLAIIKPQLAQWSSLSEPRCKNLSSVCLQESQTYSPAEEQSDPWTSE